jgi:subtilase family serine protease
LTYDSTLTTSNVVYVASSGDGPGVIYPSASPNVISAGGTSISRNPANGNFIKEITWDLAGSGVSEFESIPSYQSSTVSSIVGTGRGTPDISVDANPITGVWVYDTFPMELYEFYQWWIVGGTSVSAPTIAGILNAADTSSGVWPASTNAELTTIYTNRAVAADFRDINYGSCYFNAGYYAATGYDLCTGVGTPYGLAGK